MPRYYFHVEAKDGLIEDQEGEELPAPERARLKALMGAREILAEAIRAGRDVDVLSIIVTDEQGKRLFVVAVADALPPRFRPEK